MDMVGHERPAKPTDSYQMADLTDAIVKRLPIPAAGNRITYDPSVPGFGVRVTAAGQRAFVLTLLTTGQGASGATPSAASPTGPLPARARRPAGSSVPIDQGGDPLAEIAAERGAPTVNDLIERFLEEHVSRKRPHTQYDYRNVIERHIRPALGRMKVAEVTWSDVDALHRKITKAGRATQANRVVAVVSKMFALAIRWKMRADNPAKGIERNAEHKRKRYPSADELERLTAALDQHADQQAADIFKICLLTGARVGEAMAARWADFDLTAGIWTKPGSTTKQKTDHVVPLSAPAKQLLPSSGARPTVHGCSRPIASPGIASRCRNPGWSSARLPGSRACASTTCATASPASWPAAAPRFR